MWLLVPRRGWHVSEVGGEGGQFVMIHTALLASPHAMCTNDEIQRAFPCTKPGLPHLDYIVRFDICIGLSVT